MKHHSKRVRLRFLMLLAVAVFMSPSDFFDWHLAWHPGLAQAAEVTPFYKVATSPDGALIAERSNNRQFRVRAGQQVLWQRDDLKLSDYQTALFSPDSSLLVTLGWQTQLWEARTGVLKATLHQSDFPPITGAIASDGKTLAAGSWDSIVRFWNIQTGEALSEWKKVGGAVKQIMWLGGGKGLLVGLYHNRSDLTRAKTSANALIASGGFARYSYPGGEQLWRDLPHQDEVNKVVLAPQEDAMLSGGTDGQVFLWNIHTGENRHLHITVPRPWPANLEFSTDGQLALIAWGRDVWIYRLPSGELAGSLQLTGWKQVQFSRDGKSILDPQTKQTVPLERAFALRGEPLRLGGVAAEGTGEAQTDASDTSPHLFRRLDGWRSIAFAPNGQFVAALPVNAQDPYIYIWNAALTRITRRFRRPLTSVSTIEVAPDNTTLWMTGSLEYDDPGLPKAKVARMNLNSGELQVLASYAAPTHYESYGRGTPMAISPDYAGVAYMVRERKPEAKEKIRTRTPLTSEDFFFELRVLDIQTGKLLWQRQDAALDNVTALALGPLHQGKFTLVLLRAKRESVEAPETAGMEAYTIAPEPATLAAPQPTSASTSAPRQDPLLRLWQATTADLQTARLQGAGSQGGAWLNTAAFSPDGRWLATPGGLWDLRVGGCAMHCREHT